MPVEFGIWRVDGEEVVPVTTQMLENEAKLETIIERDPSILGLDVLLIIGRQVINAFGKRLDLLAMDSEGALYVIEVKKDRTPREVVAQALDYGFWVSDLTLDQVAEIYAKHNNGQSLDDGFRERFDTDPPEDLSADHQLLIVASSIDPATERIVQYVRRHGVPINVVFFQYFKEGDREFLARTWDADPAVEEKAPTRTQPKRPKAPWNGQDFYVSFGDDEHRSWDDAVKYGFVGAGGGTWYSKTLQQLFVGARVFAMIPKEGYVGVGTVTQTARPAKDFEIEIDGEKQRFFDLDLQADPSHSDDGDEDKLEHVAGIRWIKTLPREQAFWEKGMFANQNTVVRLRDPFTLERLTERFGLDDDDRLSSSSATDAAAPSAPEA